MSLSGTPALPLSALEMQRLCGFIYDRTGISYGEAKRYYIERRLAQGLERTGTRHFAGYMAMLSIDPREAELLINSFTVNETYFYREEHQLRCLGRAMLPEIVTRRGPGDLVRIWSMPCSTGEEPYSIAIWLLENWALVDAYNIEIVGSDVDTGALSDAMAGLYGKRALHRLPPDIIERYFEPPHDRKRRIIQDLRESVRFSATNLVDPASMAAQGRFDVIFCRNVLIYFDDASRLATAEKLFAALNPGGFLCLGHTESMSRISDRFTVRRFEEAVVYQRPLAP
ncbi:MAG: protein-glutamate O-methyltransferase CheR [Pseudomonadota bacterium]